MSVALGQSSGTAALPAKTLPPELAALDAQFIQLQAERVTAFYEADLANLNLAYRNGLTKKIAEEKAAANLDGILALEAEQNLIAQKQPLPEVDDDKTPAGIKAMRTVYREQSAKLSAQRAANLKALVVPLDKRLAQMEADFIKSDRVADAKIVRGYREALTESTPELQVAAASPAGTPTTPAAGGAKPAALLAIKDGYTNSLGMKFVPVKGTDVMFCIHETRYKDYALYASDTQIGRAHV